MISHKHRFIFVHIPKTAGTSVTACLRPYCETYLKHHHILDVLPENHDSYYKFCVARNPWDRCVSRYFYLKREPWFPDRGFYNFIINKNNEFSYGSIRVKQIKKRAHILEGYKIALDNLDDFVEIIRASSNRTEAKERLMAKYSLSERQTNAIRDLRLYQLTGMERKKFGDCRPPLDGFIKLCYKFPFDEQLDWISDTEGNVLMDFIIKFENLQEGFNSICDKIEIPHQQLPHKNKTKHQHYTKYYDDETRQIVAEKYAKDIEVFGYEFGK